MRDIDDAKLEAYLRALTGERVIVSGVRRLESAPAASSPKAYGYGVPLQVNYVVAGRPRRAVVEFVRGGNPALYLRSFRELIVHG